MATAAAKTAEVFALKVKTMTMKTAEVMFKVKGLTLVGRMPAIGQPAPDALLVANDGSTVHLSDFFGKNKKVIIAAVPSLDTSVCALETRRFDQEAAKLGPDVQILVVSMDLPFAQSRWCGAAGVSNIRTLSDHKEAAFGSAYGVLIKELRLLARSVFVVDAAGMLRYRQLVEEMTHEPNYDEVLDAAKSL
jgi:thioredoxin-dependent peroxiredoxin